ncbi:aldehyde dehydrogenase family protein [Nocardioides sp.]|uniref:aldehyde dehydrogenase family protein n=1 Tax=Nocardioides sp. TaxID=35761 RepID=UPI003514B7EA
MLPASPRTLALPWTHVDDVFVDGAWLAVQGTGAGVELVDPATDEVWGSVPDVGAEVVDLAVGAAHRAFADRRWRDVPVSERAAVLVRAAALLEARADALAHTVTRENGSTITETSGAAANAAAILRHTASLSGWLTQDDVRPFPHGPGETVVHRDPLGVCALIAPWNFPINLMVIKLAPALLAGNSVVMKPAPSTSLSIRFVLEALVEAGVPAGVLNLVTGGAACGDALVRHPLVAKVAFTGSTPVGRRIGAVCGELLRPVTLELGGKSAAIVMPDADLAALTAGLVRSCLRNSGQTCYIATRLLVPRSRHDEIVAAVAEVVAAAAVGDPLDPATVFGPVASAAQRDAVVQHLERAADEGVRFTTGGRALPGPGCFVAPTVALAEPHHSLARDEVFGPVLTLIAYDDADGSVEEAITIANDTSFGLGGIVFGRDAEAAEAVARRIDTGSVGINFFASNHDAPFGGRHDSGLGVEYGVEGLAQYVTFQSLHRR